MTDAKHESVVLETVIDHELQYIRNRRGGTARVEGVRDTLVGLALSGGGIRSATTCLGILQGLSRMGILPLVDYLSTVSGGGYIGSCLSSLLSLSERKDENGCAQTLEGKDDIPLFTTEWKHFPFNPGSAGGKAQIAHLRTHGSFLVTRKGLLTRETMRSIGHLVSATLYHLSIVLLALVTAALFYMAVILYGAPNLHASLSNITEPIVSLNEPAYEIRTVDGRPQRVEVAPFRQPTLVDRLNAKLQQFGSAIQMELEGLNGTTARRLLIVAAVYGVLLSLLAFLYLRKTRDLGQTARVGESAYDAREVAQLGQVGGIGLLLTIGWFLIALRSYQNVVVLAVTAIAMGAAWATSFVLNLLLPRMPGWLADWGRNVRSLWGAFLAMTGYAFVTAVGLALFPVAVYSVREHEVSVGTFGLISLVAARALTFRGAPAAGRRRLPAGVLKWLLGLAIGLGVLLVLIAIAASLVPGNVDASVVRFDAGRLGWSFLICGGVFVALGLLVDSNRLSPHYFYRDRLGEAYLFTEHKKDENDPLTVLRDDIDMKLKNLHYKHDGSTARPRTRAPYHLISTAVNLASSRDLTRKDRKSGYFLFSKLYCGSTHTRFMRTELYRGGDTRLARAITISGAAASSAIGAGTFFAQAFATVLFNLRLGVWMANPRDLDSGTKGDEQWHFWPKWLWLEMFMRTNDHQELVNLSDGGHTGDNVGIYPLLQRRCRVIIACDAECDGDLTFGSFTEALRQAYVDHRIDIDIDLTMIRPDRDTGMSRSHCAVGLIHYPAKDGHEEAVGYLIYLKNSLTGDEPEPVLNYKSGNAAFPHESTVDQFFDDAQFESYRALGVHIAEQTFGSWISDPAFRDLKNGWPNVHWSST